MKNKIKINLALIAMLLFVNNSFSQTQRLVLFEEFTGENCPPCATQNPALNALLSSNTVKIVSIKYQNGIPFGNPNLYAYNHTDADAAGTYYSNSTDPIGHMDGNIWTAAPNTYSQTLLDNRYAVASPFSIQTSKTFSVAHDSVYVHVVITATQAISAMSQLMARIAITESHVQAAATFNGETEWFHPMRKMLPDHNGTMLQANWSVGDSVVLNMQWKIAAVVAPATSFPDWTKLEVVAFVQDDATKEVLQTGFSPASGNATGIADLPSAVNSFSVFPNPASDIVSINLELKETTNLLIDVADITGKQVAIISEEKQNGIVTKQFNTALLPNGNYFVRLQVNGKSVTQKLTITH